MMNYYERYQPDVVLAYNDLAKEAEAFGCRVKYSDYVVPRSMRTCCTRTSRFWPGCPCPTRTRPDACPASSNSARPW